MSEWRTSGKFDRRWRWRHACTQEGEGARQGHHGGLLGRHGFVVRLYQTRWVNSRQRFEWWQQRWEVEAGASTAAEVAPEVSTAGEVAAEVAAEVATSTMARDQEWRLQKAVINV